MLFPELIRTYREMLFPLLLVSLLFVGCCAADGQSTPSLAFGVNGTIIRVTPAAFGSNSQGIVGGILNIYPDSERAGCDGDSPPAPAGAWIAVVARGGCTFVEKAKRAQVIIVFLLCQLYMNIHMQAENATAIVIYDYDRVPDFPAPVPFVCKSQFIYVHLTCRSCVTVVRMAWDRMSVSQLWQSLMNNTCR